EPAQTPDEACCVRNSTAQSDAISPSLPLREQFSLQALRSRAWNASLRHARVQVCLDRYQLEAVMIRRRELLGIGSAARSSCAWRCLYSPAITLPGAISASRMFAGLRAN